jgi:hypothetical protein
MRGYGLDLCGPVAGCCEKRNGPSVSIKIEKFFLTNCQSISFSRWTRPPFIFLWWGAPQQMLQSRRSLEAYFVTPSWRGFVSFPFFPSNWAPVEWNWQGKIEVLGENSVPVSLCPPQITNGPTQDRTRVCAVTGRRLTAWAMARRASVPFELFNPLQTKRNLFYIRDQFVPRSKHSTSV